MKLISELTDRQIKEMLILNECKKSQFDLWRQQIKFLVSDYFWMVTFSQLLREVKCPPCVFFSSSQMYVHHGIHDLIFNFVGTLEASQVGVTLEAQYALYVSRYLSSVSISL